MLNVLYSISTQKLFSFFYTLIPSTKVVIQRERLLSKYAFCLSVMLSALYFITAQKNYFRLSGSAVAKNSLWRCEISDPFLVALIRKQASSKN